MNILVLNGSPKGQYSITLQTINFLMKIYPEHSFNVLHVGQRIKAFERDFSDAAESLKKADLITEEREKNFIFYDLNISVVEEVMLWLSDLKGGDGNEKRA